MIKNDFYGSILSMTVLDASNALVVWFLENESFCIEEDFNKVVLITENKQRDLAAVRGGLEKLVKANILAYEKIEDTEYWTLTKPIEQYEQEVEITTPIAKDIARIINDFCDAIDDQLDRCDSTSINPKDIKNLTLLCDHYKDVAYPEKDVDQ